MSLASSTPNKNRSLTLKSRPEGNIDTNLPGTFQQTSTPVPQLQNDQILVRVDYVSIDPAMRGWLRDARSYIPPVQIDEVMRAGGVGTVVKSEVSDVQEGDQVSGLLGWQEYAVLQKGSYTKIPKGSKALEHLGILGSSGQTAYWGLFDVGKVKEGDVVVVTGAAGSVGNLVVQLAKIKGAKVIAVAGGAEKCKWIKDLGADIAIDYKDKDFTKTYKKTLKENGYIDIMFDNVGGEILDTTLLCLKPHARIVMCGAISDYNSTEVTGLRNYQTLVAMRGRMEGFIVFDYAKRYAEAGAQMSEWVSQGKLKSQFSIEEGGLEACPKALAGLFEGKNLGKQVVKISSA